MENMQITNLPELTFDVQEAINQLRINIGFAGDTIKTIMITSTVPNEGKSFISMNLWRNIANVGNNVLLIDTDIRNSVMRHDYGFKLVGGMVGLEHFLSGKLDLNSVIYSTNVRNGYIIPVSTNIIDPTILLESERFGQMIQSCREKFDYVIIDTPPLGSVADGLNIAKHVDGTLLVVASNEAPRRMIMDAMNSLKRTETPVLGCVLNRVNTTKKSSKYGYYYGSYGKYGDYYYGGKR